MGPNFHFLLYETSAVWEFPMFGMASQQTQKSRKTLRPSFLFCKTMEVFFYVKLVNAKFLLDLVVMLLNILLVPVTKTT